MILYIISFLIFGLVIIEGISYVALKKYGEGIDGMPTVAWEEFPDINEKLLGKFTSFDPELGWCPQPNMTKKKDTGDHLPGEEVENVIKYSTDKYGSRVCNKERDPSSDISISTYGDSYCFCRGVNDDETIQHYLSEKLDIHVGNYGGGNYGLDQGLLRLKKQYSDDPTDYVFMIITASSIARILSVWKHYQEFGNILAVKPRFKLENSSLKFIENPIDEKEDLLNLEIYKEFLRNNDYHYSRWFKKHLVSFPYSLYFFSDLNQVKYSIYTAFKNLESKTGVRIPVLDFDKLQKNTSLKMEEKRAEYHDRLFDEKKDLFSEIVGEFVSYSEEKEFTPILVMVQQLRYAEYEQNKQKSIYGDLLNNLEKQYPKLKTIDISEKFNDIEDKKSLYVQQGEGGHYSPETNEKIADILLEEIITKKENI